MKLVSLNIWGGRLFDPLISFFQSYADKVDIFCLQEIYSTSSGDKEEKGIRLNIYSEISSVLPGFQGFFTPAAYGLGCGKSNYFKTKFGLAIFVKKSISIESAGDIFIYRKRFDKVYHGLNTPNNLQYATVKQGKKKFFIGNFHGRWYPGSKLDTRLRIKQSRKIKSFLGEIKGAKILCGDFNLLPETKSIQILEEEMRNLIKDFKIKATRSKIHRLNWHKKTHYKFGLQKFADYVFVSHEVKVGDFKVLPKSISDHLPLLLDFS